MPRRREVPKREILPDPKYANTDVAKFINVLMDSGKKSVAERIIYGAFESISKKGGKDPLEIFNQALSNSRPTVEVKSRRVGGANFQVPVEVRPVRRMALAMRWASEDAGQVIDPHTAIALAAARRADVGDVPIVTLATAHPAKFRDAVERSTGARPALPKRIGDLFDREERYDSLPGTFEAVTAYIAERAVPREAG